MLLANNKLSAFFWNVLVCEGAELCTFFFTIMQLLLNKKNQWILLVITTNGPLKRQWGIIICLLNMRHIFFSILNFMILRSSIFCFESLTVMLPLCVSFSMTFMFTTSKHREKGDYKNDKLGIFIVIIVTSRIFDNIISIW